MTIDAITPGKTSSRLRAFIPRISVDAVVSLDQFETADIIKYLTDQGEEVALGDKGANLLSIAASVSELHKLIRATHSAKGRYHTQIAMCNMYDHVGLPNVRPVKDAKDQP